MLKPKTTSNYPSGLIDAFPCTALPNAFTRAFRPLLKSFDITYSPYVVIMALWEQCNATIAALLDKTVINGRALARHVTAQTLCNLKGMSKAQMKQLIVLIDKLLRCFNAVQKVYS